MQRITTILAATAFACLTGASASAQAPTRTIIQNVNIVTLDERGVIEGGAIVVRNGHIESILRAGQHAPRGATVIDGQGGYLIPGLIDAHVHYNTETELAGYLRYGVTTVLSLGTPSDQIESLLNARRRQANDEFVGAHLYATGQAVANHVQLRTAPEVEPFLTTMLDGEHLDYIKTYNEIPQDVFDAVVAGARRRGVGVFGHMPRQFAPEYTLTHGLNVVAHMEEFFFTTFQGPRDRDLDALSPDWTPDYARIDPILDLAAANDVAIIPDLVASFTFQNLWADEERVLAEPEMNYFSAEDADGIRHFNYSHRDNIERRMLREQIKYPLIRTMTYRAQQRGVLLLAGTDAPIPGVFPGRSLHEELRLMAAAGLTREQALRTATINNGTAVRRWVDHNTCIGVIQPACEADLVLLRGNPLEDIRQTQAIVGVMEDGRWHTPEELEARARRR